MREKDIRASGDVRPPRQRRSALSTPVADYDSPWKDALEEYLEGCFALFFADAHAEIDWSQPYEFLDTELRQAVRDAEIGPLRADRLVRVRLRNGRDAWVLIHIEIQSQPERGFARRMFDYYCRIRLHFGEEVVSLAVLADERASWRPDRYEEGRWGCSMDFRYPVVKLADWRARQATLEASENPFATVVLAHLAAQDTQGKVHERRRVKIEMIQRLFARGYSRERVLSLLRFIDWLLALPSTIEKEVRQEIAILEEGRKMPYVTSWERMSKAEGLEQGLEQGREEGKRQAIRQVLGARFGGVPARLDERIAKADKDELDELLLRAAVAGSVEEL